MFCMNGVAVHDHARGAITLETTHRTAPRLEPAVIGLDPIVRELLGIVERTRHELVHDEECPCPVGHHFRRLVIRAERRAQSSRAARMSRFAET
jgi:hypothetical protein